MTGPRFTPAGRIEEAFAAALETPESGREDLLARLLPDPDERAQVRRLLTSHASIEASGYLDHIDSSLAGALLDDLAKAPAAIGRYRVERRLARGGHGLVYLAHDPDLDRPVAIKLLPPERAGSVAARERLRAEARLISALDHPNIATIHEIGQTDRGELYIVMAYHAGETLRARLARGPLPLPEARRIGSELADALAAAHDRSIVHRDVKPENVILTERGVRLVDFGIAATTDAARRGPGAAGTVAYMSPEQVRGAPLDPRTDVWALGVVLYEMLAGRRPFTAASPDAVLDAIRSADPVPLQKLRPEVPDRMARAVHACLAKEPGNRSSGAGEVRRRLDGVGARRRTLTVTAILLLVAGLVVGSQLSRPTGPVVSPRGTADPVAESLYVRAMALLETRSPSDLEQAAINLRTAIARDSNFARAYAGLARVVSLAPANRSADRYARIKPLLERAVAIDSTLPDVLHTLGWIALWYDRDLLRAEHLLRRALALEPNDPWKYHYYAAWLSLVGRIDEAVDLERQAMVIDPRGAATATHVGMHLTRQGKYDEAIALLERTLARDSTWPRTHVVLGRAYLSAGRHQEAIRHLRRDNYEFAGFDPAAMLAYGLGIAGQREEARAITRDFEHKAREGYLNPINLIACYLGLGEIEKALDWAERIPGDAGLLWFPRSDLMYEPLFSEPRFRRVLEQVGLDSATVALMPDTRAAIEAILKPAARSR